MISTGIFIAYSIIPIGKHVDHAAHFGGLISGYIFGWMAYFDLKYQKHNIVAAGALAITVSYTGLSIWLAPVYQLEELQQLSNKTESLFTRLNNDFYHTDDLTRNQRLVMLNNQTLRRVDTLSNVGKKLQGLTLPAKEKQVANIKSKIIVYECSLFTLLYKEFRDNDRTKYRNEINSTTNRINELRLEWGRIEYPE